MGGQVKCSVRSMFSCCWAFAMLMCAARFVIACDAFSMFTPAQVARRIALAPITHRLFPFWT
jgi:hypothetical protein